MKRAVLGAQGEAVAAKYYQKQGFSLYAHNFRCRMGELDLVLVKGTLLVIAEVKTRSSARFSQPREAVDRAKQRRLVLASRCLLTQLPPQNWTIRFDVVEVRPNPGGGYQIQCFPGAFEADGF